MKRYTCQCHKTNLVSMSMSFVNILHIAILLAKLVAVVPVDALLLFLCVLLLRLAELVHAAQLRLV